MAAQESLTATLEVMCARPLVAFCRAEAWRLVGLLRVATARLETQNGNLQSGPTADSKKRLMYDRETAEWWFELTGTAAGRRSSLRPGASECAAT